MGQERFGSSLRIALLLSLLAAANAGGQTRSAEAADPTADDPCAEVMTFPVPGSEPGTVSHAIVVVPREYGLKGGAATRPGETGAAAKRYPVVYLLHGYGGGYLNWYVRSREADRPLSTYADRYGMILVSVDGKFASWYLDAPPDSDDPANWQIETAITKHLIPEVDRRYRTWAEPTGRALLGLSMGGHGALYLTARHPELFSACGDLSGVLELAHVINKQNLIKRLGPLEKNAARWTEHSAMTQAEQFVGRRVGVMLDCGFSDSFFEDHRLLHEKLTRLQVAHEYVVRPGGHDWPYWIHALPFHLQFFSERLQTAGIPQPTPSIPKLESVMSAGDLPRDAQVLELADMDGDGRLDVIAAGAGGVSWYANESWARHVVGVAVGKINSLAAEDIDRDGRMDLAVAADAPGLCWLRNGPEERWAQFTISGVDGARSIRWADVDADGRRELLTTGEGGKGIVVWHVPAKPDIETWQREVVSDRIPDCRAILPLRFFAAPYDQMLTASADGVHLLHRDPANGAWLSRHLGAGNQNGRARGSCEVAVGRLREGQRFLAATEPGKAGDETAVYIEPPYSQELWKRVVIEGKLASARGVACTDLDGDGDDEIVAGVSVGAASGVEHGLRVYKASRESAAQWDTRWMDKAPAGVTALGIGALRAAKRPAVIAICGDMRVTSRQ